MAKLTLKEIINWIVENSDDEDAMDKIASIAYPFGKKFKNRYADRRSYDDNNEPTVHT